MVNRRKNNKVHRLDRNKMVGPMTEFVRIPNPPGAEEQGVLATFENNKYGVFLKKILSPGFATTGPDGHPQRMEIMHMIIFRLDKNKTEIPWGEKQFIKNNILGENSEGMELLPAETRRMRTIPETQTHLWVLPPGSMIPAGLIPKAMQALAQQNALEKFTVSKEELELYVIEDGGVMQVFASSEEAEESYSKTGNEMPEGKVGRVGDVPTEDTGIVWSDGSKVKVAKVLEKASTLSDLMGEEHAGEEISESRINTNGPVTDQDELEEAHSVGDFAPNSDEENVMMPEYMKLGVEQMKKDRVKSIKDAVVKLASWSQKQKERAEREAANEEMAKDELEAMREQARKDRKE